MVKQVIIIRKDLNMRKGKMCSQSAHASMKVFFDMMVKQPLNLYGFKATDEMAEWIDGIFTKICVSVDSEQELIDCYNKAKEANLPCSMIEDNGLTEFGGVKTKTVVAIGPANAEDIDKITGHLKLL